MRRAAAAVLFLIAFTGTAGSQAALPAGRDDRGFRIAVNVDLVVLHASVRDRKGESVPRLRERDFEVYEDGVRQTTRLFLHDDVPVTVGLVVDHSGSMRHKIAHVVTAARTFVQASNAADEMFVVNFNENVRLGLPATVRFTNRADQMEQAISKGPTAGMTALYDAVEMGLERLGTGNHDKKALVVISDGSDNASKSTLDKILKTAGQSSALVYTVGVFERDDPDGNPGVLRRLAHATGGEAYFPEEISDVVAICERIARDIRQQYTIGYMSASTGKPGAYRTIRVTARTAGQGKLTVRTRSGYFSQVAK